MTVKGTGTSRAVVLARGLGSRMQADDPGAELTVEQRQAADAGLKAMMPIGGRPFLDYLLSALADADVREVALVVAPDHRALRHHYERAAPPARIRLSFVVQQHALGTADAVLAARTWAGGAPFLTMNADNLYPVDALRSLGSAGEPAVPAFSRGNLVRLGNIPADRVRAYALIELDAAGYLARITEKPSDAVMAQAGDDALVSMNCWRFDHRIFDVCRDVARSSRGEFELPEAVMLAVERGVRFRAIPARGAVLDLSRRADAAELSRRLAGVVPRP